MTPTVKRVLDVARSQLGKTEPGIGNNDPGNQLTSYGIWYARWSDQPAFKDTYWCAMWVSWVMATAGFTPAESGRFGNCNPWITWFKARGRFNQTPKPGAVVFFSWDGDTRAEHVGIVESIRSDRRLVTLEGNASIPGKHDGVYRMVRSPYYVVGYGHQPYAAGGAATGGTRAGYPTLTRGFGGAAAPGNERWWVGQWYRLMARHSPGFYRKIPASAAGQGEIKALEIGDATLAVTKDMATVALGNQLHWQGAITPQIWAIYPPVK